MSEDKILARVGQRKISEEDVRRLRLMLGEQAQHFEGEEGDKRLLDELINQELLYLDAIDRSLDKDQAFLDQYEAAKKQMLQQYALNSLLGKFQVSVEETEAYFSSHKDQFSEEELKNKDELLKRIYMQLLLLKQQAGYVNFTKELEEKYSVERY